MTVPEPDYPKSVKVIYQEVTQAAPLHDQPTNIVGSIILFGVTPDAPTWVPNWNGSGSRTISRVSFHTAKISPPSFHFSSDGTRLTLSGICVDEIAGRRDPVHFPGRPKVTINDHMNIAEDVNSVPKWHRLVQHLKPYRTGQSAQGSPIGS